MLEWNKCYYVDCMNEVNGLPTLPDKSVDLCLTDPPYNIKDPRVQGSGGAYGQKRYISKGIPYKDFREDYFEWCLKWFHELERICNTIIFSPGRMNLFFWIRETNPKDLFIHYKINGTFGGRVSRFNLYEPYLVYGKIKRWFWGNVFNVIVNNGFLIKNKTLCVCPKNPKLWRMIIDQIKPSSVIDPFLGSGTMAEVCTKLGIKWLGYEINEIYSQDINKRLKGCKKEPQQITLELFE